MTVWSTHEAELIDSVLCPSLLDNSEMHPLFVGAYDDRRASVSSGEDGGDGRILGTTFCHTEGPSEAADRRPTHPRRPSGRAAGQHYQ